MGSSRPQPRFLGKKLREIRKRLDVTQQAMAEIVGHKKSPVYPGHISEFEAGRRVPSLLVLLQYARVGKVSVEALIDDELDLG
jgi:transcriptional regulator with XRE-family HTH domain